MVVANRGFDVNHIYLSVPENKSLNQTQVRFENDQQAGQSRIDDTDLLMRARLMRFRRNTIPMLKELQKEHRLNLIRADRPINEIHNEIKKLLIPGTRHIESISQQTVGRLGISKEL